MITQLSIPFLSEPTNQCASVLKMLIENIAVSERDTVFNGFRSRISDLRLKHGINIRHIEEKFVNQFGRKASYRKHFIYEYDKDNAVKIYNEINGK